MHSGSIHCAPKSSAALLHVTGGTPCLALNVLWVDKIERCSSVSPSETPVGDGLAVVVVTDGASVVVTAGGASVVVVAGGASVVVTAGSVSVVVIAGDASVDVTGATTVVIVVDEDDVVVRGDPVG